MPHSANRQPLKIGDRVTMTFTILEINESEVDDTVCNCTLQAMPTRYKEMYLPIVACNTVLVYKAPEVAPPPVAQ